MLLFLSASIAAAAECEGETYHVKQWFGTLRTHLSRVVRCAYSFSKCAENYLDAVHLFITTHNLSIRLQAPMR